MKAKLILGSLLALTSIVHAQWSGTNPEWTNTRVGIKTTTPAYDLDIFSGPADGIRILRPSGGGANTGAAALHLHNATTGGKNWSIYSLGSGDGWVGPGGFAIGDNVGYNAQFIIDATGNVGIGRANGASPITLGAKLDVAYNITASGGYYGIKGVINHAWSTGVLVGVLGSSSTTGKLSASSIGLQGVASGGQRNYGGLFSATGDTTVSGHLMFGVYSSVTAAGANDWAGYFIGKCYTSATTWYTSDQKLKRNIKALTSSMEKIRQLKPSSYEYRLDEFKNLVLPEGRQMGVIAQDLEKVFPELVTNIAAHDRYNDKGEITETLPAHKAVNYIGLIPVLLSGIQEQDKLISIQQQQLDEQKQLIDALTQKVSGTTGIGNVNTIETGFQMSQNEPNPFTHETQVKYTLPQTVSNAFMAVYDLTGKQITTFPIHEKGSSSLTITSEKLAAGIYIYSIVADGKVIDSKRMIVAEK